MVGLVRVLSECASERQQSRGGSSRRQSLHGGGPSRSSRMMPFVRTYSGTATISMKEGPASDVPIVINLSSDDTMSIMPDSTKTKGHFGNTPIQGKTNM
jgi:hypothetical protein